MFVFDADAAVKVKNNTADRVESAVVEKIGEDTDVIATLENDIRILDEEIAKCKKQKKGWIAATVIGATGTVATGVAAGVQGAKLKEQKSVAESKETELKQLKKDKQELDDELKELQSKSSK